MQRVSCLYCGARFWRPFRWLRDGEFCSAEHRQSYRERLRKITGALSVEVQPQESPITAPQTGSLEAAPAEPTPLAPFFPIVRELAMQGPALRRPSASEPLTAPIESHAHIRRWGLRMKFFS